MTKSTQGLFLGISLSIWLFLDFIGIFTSVIATYFYFGWEGTSNLVIKIALIAFATFLFPLILPLVFRKITINMYKLLLLISLLVYILLGFVRESSVFAFASLGGVFISGTTLLISFRGISSCFTDYFKPFLAIIGGFLLYAVTRQINHGIPTLLSTNIISWIMLGLIFVLFILSSKWDWDCIDIHWRKKSQQTKSNRLNVQFLACGLVLLLYLGLGIIFNLPLYNAVSLYPNGLFLLLSLALGILAGIMVFALIINFPGGAMYLILLSAAALVYGMYMVLYSITLNLWEAFMVHGISVFGMAMLLMIFIRKWRFLLSSYDKLMPTIGFQLGFFMILGSITLLMLFSSVKGYWVLLTLAILLFLLSDAISFNEPPKETKFYKSNLVSLGVIIALLVVSFMGIYLYHYVMANDLPTGGDEMKVISYNIRYGWTDEYEYKPYLSADYIWEQEADIIGFQEVCSGSINCSFTDLYQFYKYMSGNYEYYAFGDANYGFGQMLFSKYPIIEAKNMRFSDKAMMERTCLWVLLQIDDKQVEVFNVHLAHEGDENPVRRAQLEELKGWVSQSQRPWIVMGDFNAEPDSFEIESFFELLPEVFTEQYYKIFTDYSYSSLNPYQRIDYIFFSEHFDVRDYQILDNYGFSDHKPVMSKLSITNP